MTLYERIRELRTGLGMSQDDLARAMGYKDRSMITKIESGKVDISQKKIVAFARALNTTPAYLMGWTDDVNAYMHLQLFASDQASTKEARIISYAVDNMPPEDREKALKMFSAVYSDYIQKAEDKIG